MEKTVLVTGGGRGIGRGIAVELAKRGYSVAVNYVSDSQAAGETLNLCRSSAADKGQRFLSVKADISDPRDRAALTETVFAEFGGLACLVNNAGVAPQVRADILEMSEESYDRVLGINLKAPFFLTQQIAARWLEPGYKRRNEAVVFVSSVSAETVSINRGEYCISKAGISMAASLFAARLAEEGIPVFEVRPGIIKTDMTSKVEAVYSEKISQGLVPQKRWGFPEDLGRTVAALLSGDFAFSTGSVIPVDGGLHIPRL